MDQPTHSPNALHGQLVRTLVVGAAFIGLCAVGATSMLDRATREHAQSRMRMGGAAVEQRYVAAPSQPEALKNENKTASRWPTFRWPWSSRYDTTPTGSTKPEVKNVISDPNAGMPR